MMSDVSPGKDLSPPSSAPTRDGRARALLLAVVILGGVALYTFRMTRNPAGFFIDESSVAYNAYTISQSGQDEFGNSWPLFFRAFGDYKNPVFVYLLAVLFKITGPSILTARLIGAIAGVVTALLLGLLAARVSDRHEVGLLVATSALLTPWLFELSRVAFEVALYPLAVTLFLLCVQRAATKPKWTWLDVGYLTSTLVLLTYTYSIGRLFAPLLALGLVFFATRQRWSGILRTWVIYILTLAPMIVFQRRHAEALTGRFDLISYIKPESSVIEIGWEFIKHYVANLNPVRLLVSGDPNTYQVAHVPGTPAILVATLSLALAGAWLVLRRRKDNAWWRFIFYGLAASIVPASLTADYFHMLRLSALPVFLLVLAVPAIAWLWDSSERRSGARILLVILFILTLAQGAFFQWQYHASVGSPWRRHLFDADYPRKIFDNAVANGARPIYLADAMTTPYIQAYWYATLKGIPLSQFVRLRPDESPPARALVISTEEGCSQPHVLAQVDPYRLYIADDHPRPRAPLPDSAFRADISVPGAPANVPAGEKLQLRVRVKNNGDIVWPGCERSAGQFQIYLGSHWLNASGQVASKEEGRSPLPADLAPGQETELSFIVDAPAQPGDTFLEVDLLQEGVSWFKLKGSHACLVTIKVEPALFR
jgi:4-amino-4-deoxy-L-arabinose transferase-like glycosyltransferase